VWWCLVNPTLSTKTDTYEYIQVSVIVEICFIFVKLVYSLI